MRKKKNYLIDEQILLNLKDVLTALETGDEQLAWLLLDGILEDIEDWCEVKEK